MAVNRAGQFIPPGNGGVTYPSPNEWPVTVHAITAITNAVQAVVTAPNHGITMSANQSTPLVDFTQVKGMYQINGKSAYVTAVIDANNVQIALNTSPYGSYTSGGYLNVLVGPPPIEPFQNTFP